MYPHPVPPSPFTAPPIRHRSGSGQPHAAPSRCTHAYTHTHTHTHTLTLNTPKLPCLGVTKTSHHHTPTPSPPISQRRTAQKRKKSKKQEKKKGKRREPLRLLTDGLCV
eukprot:TRINITY_DN4571_c10_g1_i1.p3 TRINITY_DN4571_c10_g1~~TRINITY_DN4571_c10_g1_i1.p3  ORF type:complete len:109 (+),score=2.64 TRINITY_DN4571_c10_g1_i1:559-885(+)